MTRKSLIAVAAAAASLAFTASAHADSISFLRGGDIWVAAPDGTSQVQLTRDGGYGYQSRADDGSFIALHGRQLRRLSPQGAVLAEFATPVSGEQTAPNTSYFRGPYKPEISPDGTKVAYEYWYQEFYTDPGCTPGNLSCTDSRVSTGIGYTHSDRLTAWDEPGLGRQSGWIDPSWIDNATLLQSDKSVRPNVDAIIDHPGDGNQTIAHWFEDTGVWYVRDGEVSRRGDAAAFVTTKARDASDPRIGQQDDQITIYRMNGTPPALPEQCFSFVNEQAVTSSPSFSPDGAHVVWATDMRKVNEGDSDAKDIVVGDIPSQAGGCQLPSQDGRTLITNAIQPDWSPAAVPAPISAPAAGGGAAPGGTGGAGGVKISVGRITLGRALSRGLTVKVRVPAAGQIALKAVRGGRGLGKASARATRAGTVTLRLRLTHAARRSLRGRSRIALTLRHRFTPAGGVAVTGVTAITLRP